MSTIEEKRKQRFQFLNLLYEKTVVSLLSVVR
jgi:hypothetical protein